MQMGQHHGMDLPFPQAEFGEAVQKPHSRALATAGAWRRRQERVGPGHDEDVQAALLDQQSSGGHFHLIVVVGAHPLDPHPSRCGAEQCAAVELAASACQHGNTAIHGIYLSE
ncbi:hypothetical protein FQZ97_1046970 [compost metagenome]